MFSDKVLMITGGTGSFGNAVLTRFLNSELEEIRIFSRDEKKQEDMRRKYSNPKVKFYIGDVRDLRSVTHAMRGADYVFHAAALKQVPSCEFHPLEAVKTNIMGTDNVLDAAIFHGVKKVVCLSTDKAVYPINAMGISKALMEKVSIARSRESKNTVICNTRYGNVMASRGSVIPLFLEQIRSGSPITITNGFMTRFMMSLENAVDLVLYAFEHGGSGEILVQKSPAVTIETLASAIVELTGKPGHKINIIGTRHGEKLYETVLSGEEFSAAEDLGGYYRVRPDARDMNYASYVDNGFVMRSRSEGYHSHNAVRPDVKAMQDLLMRLSIFKDTVR